MLRLQIPRLRGWQGTFCTSMRVWYVYASPKPGSVILNWSRWRLSVTCCLWTTLSSRTYKSTFILCKLGIGILKPPCSYVTGSETLRSWTGTLELLSEDWGSHGSTSHGSHAAGWNHPTGNCRRRRVWRELLRVSLLPSWRLRTLMISPTNFPTKNSFMYKLRNLVLWRNCLSWTSNKEMDMVATTFGIEELSRPKLYEVYSLVTTREAIQCAQRNVNAAHKIHTHRFFLMYT